MGKNFDKFLLLMWKNFLVQWRHPVQTVIEILAPLVLAIALVLTRSVFIPELNAAALYSPYTNEAGRMNYRQERNLVYSPQNDIFKGIVSEVASIIFANGEEGPKEVNVTEKKNSRELEAYLINETSAKNYWESFIIGIQFDDSLSDSKTLPEYVNVSLRFPAETDGPWWNWETNALYPSLQKPGPRDWQVNTGAQPFYYDSGFLIIQQELSYAIIKQLKKQQQGSFDRTSVPIYMQRFPYPRFYEDDLFEVLQYILGLIIMMCYLYTCVSTVKSITFEKEKQLKETMKIMGLPSWLHWTAWFIKTFLIMLVTITTMVIMLTVRWYPGSSYAIFTYSNPIIIFIFIFLFMCATITFCFVISVFFSRSNLAAVIAGILWIVTFVPFYANSTDLAVKLAESLLFNTAMAFGFQIIIQYEGTEEGIQWHNLMNPVSPDENIAIGHVMIMLAVDTILYLIITIYVEAVFPGEYGVPQKWYFPFSPSYWCGKKYVGNESFGEGPVENEYYEKEPRELQVGIQIQQLGKQFSKKNVAVKNLTLNLYKDQITVLLGHNGAGKTTTMSMLTGMFPPTSGTAIVEGYDIRTQMPAVRDSLGLCPQHNILFDDMTVREHLYFYSKLKGLSKSEIDAEIQKFIELLELTDKGNAKSSTLSGGMKRKLSVAIALCGGSNVVMCDEPSSGMDPSARRALWNLLQSQKKGRTILLTTHFMDEADLLGDRIAIMANGRLECCGSSYFLKKKYGAGYHLIMDKSPQCDVNQVTQQLQKYIPNIQIDSSIGSELSYILQEEDSGIFQEMLGDLERQSYSLGILSYGISLTSFDEVFMKANSHRNKDNLNDSQDCAYDNDGFDQDFNSNSKVSDVKLDVGYNPLTGCALFFNQILAMFMKRGLTILRSWFLFLLHICIPVIALVVIILVNRIVVVKDDLPALKIGLDSYHEPITVLARDPNNEYAQKYIELLQKDNTELIDWKDESIFDKMLVETKEKQGDVNVRYLTGATFWKNNTITAWFNNNPLHTPPLALQTVMNAILLKEVSSKHYIQFNNHPLPFPEKATDSDSFGLFEIQDQVAIILGFAMAFVSTFYIMFYVRERVNNAKHLQFVSGVRVPIFWGSAYICDLLTFIVISLFIIATFAALQEEGFNTAEDLGHMFSILFHFGISVLPMMYLASFVATVPATGYVKMVFINVILGVGLFLIINPLKSAIEENNLHFIHYILFFVPLYSFCWSISDVTGNYFIRKRCAERIQDCIEREQPFCQSSVCERDERCCVIRDYYEMTQPGIGTNVLYAYLVAVGLFLVVLGIEYRLFETIRYLICSNRPPPPPSTTSQIDHDVQKEKDIIKNASMEEVKKYDLSMRSVTKYYKNFLAVNDLCLGVNRYECFGLLGVNGAGKTTTFKMMTGEIQLSGGDSWVTGLNLKTNMKQIHKFIGYCPQFDALIDNLTCRETIIMFSLLRGFTVSESKAIAKKLARDFDFRPHLYKKVKQLSGGNKRKLSTALTLIGDPLVLYLDEPTTGMDPATKRYLWKALCKVRDSGKCIILTSHSMEECEALCTRIAIMVNGGFMCLGSTQHLKSKFSEGYTLIVRVRKTNGRYDVESIERFVNENFRSAVMRENNLELVTFYIPDRTKPWSEMFGIMEQGKKILNIEDYSLGQSSLEQVFLSFTKYQQTK